MRVDRRAGGLAAARGGRNLDVRVVAKPLSLPRLVVGAEEGAVTGEGDAHGRRDRRAVALVRGEQNGLGLSQGIQRFVRHALKDEMARRGVTGGAASRSVFTCRGVRSWWARYSPW